MLHELHASMCVFCMCVCMLVYVCPCVFVLSDQTVLIPMHSIEKQRLMFPETQCYILFLKKNYSHYIKSEKKIYNIYSFK